MLSELQNWEISFAYIKLVIVWIQLYLNAFAYIKLVIVWIQPYFNEDNVQAVLF